jgi:hypothetical protein
LSFFPDLCFVEVARERGGKILILENLGGKSLDSGSCAVYKQIPCGDDNKKGKAKAKAKAKADPLRG